MSTITEQIRSLLKASCGDERRAKGCWTARRCAETNDAASALSNGECICEMYVEERAVIERIAELEAENAVLVSGVLAAEDMVDDSCHWWASAGDLGAWEEALAVAKGGKPKATAVVVS